MIYGFDSAGFLQELQTNLVGNVAGFSVGRTSTARRSSRPPGVGRSGRSTEPRVSLDARHPDERGESEQDRDRDRDDEGLGRRRALAGHPHHRLPAGVRAKVLNVDKITFADLLAHTSGLAYNDPMRIDSQDEEAIEAGTLMGRLRYENVNYGLCRILLATVTAACRRPRSCARSRRAIVPTSTTTCGTPARSLVRVLRGGGYLRAVGSARPGFRP